MKKICCFGELLLRFSPQLQGEWIHHASMPVYVGGAELNAAHALALWHLPVRYCTAIPENYLSKEILASLEAKNIDTSRIHFSGQRIGTYYLPQGADLKNAGVIYDRSHSSTAMLQPGDINWEQTLEGVTWFHFSAITPALSASAALVCEEALKEAAARNIFISVDLNYRSKLWQYGKDPQEVMPELVKYCNLVMGNIWAAEKMLGVNLPAPLQRTKEVLLNQAEKSSRQLMESYPACRQVANTFRFDHDSGVSYYATLYDGSQLYVSYEQQVEVITDRVGSGDCFMAGLIYGNTNRFEPQQIIDFATTAACKKFAVKGDATTVTVNEIKNSMPKYA